MPYTALRFREVTFQYESMTAPLFRGLTVHFSAGWTGVIGANGSGKSTLIRLAAGELEPRGGIVERPGRTISCAQRTDHPDPGLEDFLAAADGAALRLRGMLNIGDDWSIRWDTLSHGERKRSQVAVALWKEPHALALDEPTNHLDSGARALLVSALGSFRGIGILVSHDRELLDMLCARCLFLEPPDAALYTGSYSACVRQRRETDASLRRKHELARETMKKLDREMKRRQEKAAGADRKRSKRHLSPGDHDGRDKINRARVTGKDAVQGNLAHQLSGRLEKAAGQLRSTAVARVQVTGIRIDAAPARRDLLFRISEGVLSLGAERMLRFPALAMLPDDRVAITGLNGMGKSTLVRHILTGLNVSPERVMYIPQEFPSGMAEETVRRARSLAPDALGRAMTVVSRLGSQPERLLETENPSPGELRKLSFALGMAGEPHLVVMDEPTNHMDLPSILCLEEALEECRCGLLLVSHDSRFLCRVSRTWWRIHASEEGAGLRVESGPPETDVPD